MPNTSSRTTALAGEVGVEATSRMLLPFVDIVTSWSDEEARNFNRDTHLDYDTRYERAEEFARVVTGLWDSWEDDAFVRDKASGLYYAPDKLHVLDHQGKHFKVRGPLNSAATPQGRHEICKVYSDT